MSNPLTVAALTSFSSVANLTSLANGAAKGLGSVGAALTQYYDDLVAPIQIKSGASGVSASGSASFYIVCSEDNSHWTNAIDPTSGSDQSAKLVGLPLLLPTLAIIANATTYVFAEFSIYSVLGFMPSFWSIVVYNQSGAAFDGTGGSFIANHSLVSYA